MERWKKIGKDLLFPHIAIMIILLPVATAFLIYAMELSTRRLFLALSGGAISVFIIVMAIYMIVRASKALKKEHHLLTEAGEAYMIFLRNGEGEEIIE